MKVLDRLKMELSNQQYFTDEQHTQFLVKKMCHNSTDIGFITKWHRNS